MRWLILAVAMTALIGCSRQLYSKYSYDGRQYIVATTEETGTGDDDEYTVYVQEEDGSWQRAPTNSMPAAHKFLARRIIANGTHLGRTDVSEMKTLTKASAAGNKDAASKTGH